MKTQLILTRIYAGMILFWMASCQSPSENTSLSLVSKSVSPDSLIQDWNVAWNTKDSTKISGYFTDQSVVIFSTNHKMAGQDSIMKNWISGNLPAVANLKTEKISSASSSNLAYYSGTYSLDIIRNDSLVGTDIGIFTTIWKLQSDQSWKIENMIFGESQEE
jgi:ketosteroid isomerase-like protein